MYVVKNLGEPEEEFYPWYKRTTDRALKNLDAKNVSSKAVNFGYTLAMLMKLRVHKGKLKVILREYDKGVCTDIWYLDWKLALVPWQRKLLLNSCWDKYISEEG